MMSCYSSEFQCADISTLLIVVGYVPVAFVHVLIRSCTLTASVDT